MAFAGALAQVARWDVPSAGAAVVDATGVRASTGTADVLPWASVTKPLVALAVLDAVQEGLVDLDEPAGPPGATVRHLLAHAAGLPPDGDAPLSPPGRRRIYSNRGFEVLGELVAQREGAPLADRLTRRVLQPLGMTATVLDGSPAHGARGPVSDLAALAHELLEPTLLDPDLLAQASAVAFPGLDGVLPGYGAQRPNDWGLGFEIRDAKSPHWTGALNSPRTLGHFGRSGSFLWVDPDAGLACVALAAREFGPWAVAAWPALSDAVLRSALDT